MNSLVRFVLSHVLGKPISIWTNIFFLLLWAYPAAGTIFLSSVEFCSGVWLSFVGSPAPPQLTKKPLVSLSRALRKGLSPHVQCRYIGDKD